MADIPVERKGGMPGWVWLLLALLLILLLFLLFGRGCGDDMDTDIVAPDTTTEVVEPDMTVGDDLDIEGPADIEDINLLFERASAGAIIGQSIRFTDVAVSDVTGDSTFYVTNGTDRAFVVLEDLGESQSGMGSADGRYSIQATDTLDIEGRVASLDEDMRGRWTVRTDAAQDYYIRARRVDDQ